ncbi:MAG: FAD-dependent oxidoreductase [Planctomycetota bacterium]
MDDDLEVDILIVGAGIQGLWLLDEAVRAGYSALLLERTSIGGEQTLHSHGYIHRGFGYPHCPNVADFQQAAARWREFVSADESLVSHSSANVGFLGLATSLLWEQRWRAAMLSYAPDGAPHLAETSLRKLYRTDEFAVHLGRVIRHLVRPVRDLVCLGEVTEICVANRRVTSVRAIIGSCALRIVPRALVLAAGEGNARLVSLIDHGTSGPAMPVHHHLRKSHVVIVRGEGLLDPLNLLVPDIWLFIVSQTDDEGQPVWLVTGGVDEAYSGNDEPEARQVEQTVARLRAFHPRLFSSENRAKMQWGVYVGSKVEADARADVPSSVNWQVRTFGVENLFAVWPTKLTFAPLASGEILNGLRERGILPADPRATSTLAQRDFASPPPFRRERWRDVDFLPWQAFRDAYDIRD